MNHYKVLMVAHADAKKKENPRYYDSKQGFPSRKKAKRWCKNNWVKFGGVEMIIVHPSGKREEFSCFGLTDTVPLNLDGKTTKELLKMRDVIECDPVNINPPGSFDPFTVEATQKINKINTQISFNMQCEIIAGEAANL